MSTDVERLNEALANEGVVWRVLDGNHDDYIEAHDAFAVFAELVEEYRDLLANGKRAETQRHMDASLGKHCLEVDEPGEYLILVDPTTEEER